VSPEAGPKMSEKSRKKVIYLTLASPQGLFPVPPR